MLIEASVNMQIVVIFRHHLNVSQFPLDEARILLALPFRASDCSPPQALTDPVTSGGEEDGAEV